MIFTALQSTLREMRLLVGNARLWVGLVTLSLIVGLMGPFGTFEMPTLGRIAYWVGVVTGTAATGMLFCNAIESLIGNRLPHMVGATLAGAVSGVPITLLVVVINFAVFGIWAQPIDAASLLVYCVLIAAAVSVLSEIVKGPAPRDPASASSPALLARLALPQRGRLLHLEVADHYVEVATDRGKSLLLMRLSDAIRETAPVEGLQVHRSHWVALDAVRKTSRQSGKLVLELENGALVPISRSYLDAAKTAGLVPQ